MKTTLGAAALLSLTCAVLTAPAAFAGTDPEHETATFTYTSKPLDLVSFIFDGALWNEPLEGVNLVVAVTDVMRRDYSDPPTVSVNGDDVVVRFLDPTSSHYDWSTFYFDNGDFNFDFSRDDPGDMLNDRIAFTHSASGGDKWVETYGMNTDGRYIPMEVTFANNTPGQWTPYDWNSPVSAVPEPDTYMMMMGGLGLIGWVARKKKPASQNRTMALSFS